MLPRLRPRAPAVAPAPVQCCWLLLLGPAGRAAPSSKAPARSVRRATTCRERQVPPVTCACCCRCARPRNRTGFERIAYEFIRASATHEHLRLSPSARLDQCTPVPPALHRPPPPPPPLPLLPRHARTREHERTLAQVWAGECACQRPKEGQRKAKGRRLPERLLLGTESRT